MGTRTLIAATESAVSTPVMLPRIDTPGAVTVIGASGLSGSEEVQVWIVWEAGGSWERLRDYKDSGALVTITATSGPAFIGSAGLRLGVTKQASSYPVAVYCHVQDGLGS